MVIYTYLPKELLPESFEDLTFEEFFELYGQLAIMGQLQTTMSGSEAATKYKSFLNQASSAGEKLGLTFLDTNNQLLSMPDILTELKGKYGETIDAVEKRELKEAFGTDEAVALIDLLYNNVETLDSGIQDLQGSMKNGISVTEEMAEAINNTPEQKFQVLKQQIHNNVEELGNGLLPAVNNTMDKVSGLIQKGSKWISNNQETVQSIMNIALKLGVFLVIAGSVMGVIGSLMNDTNVTTGGYVGSKMYKTVLPVYAAALQTALNNHILSHRELLTTAVSTTGNSNAGAGITGYASNWEWKDCLVKLMSEIQVYGSTVLSSSFYDTGCDNIQFPLFRLAPNLKVAGLGHNGSRWWYWLSAVVSAAAFAYCSVIGDSCRSDAAGDGGVRPYFCIG